MKKEKIIFATMLIAVCLFGIEKTTSAQSGEIRGVVKDKTTHATLPGVIITYFISGRINAVQTDENGFYKIKPLQPGMYDVKFSMITYDTLLQQNIRVAAMEVATVNADLNFTNELPVMEVIEQRIPLIPRGGITNIMTLTSKEIEESVAKDIGSVASIAAQVYQRDAGEPLFIKGSRSNATKYIVDGLPMDDQPHIPSCAIEQLSVITGGLPAMYGDCTGGVIVVTTKSYKMN